MSALLELVWVACGLYLVYKLFPWPDETSAQDEDDNTLNELLVTAAIKGEKKVVANLIQQGANPLYDDNEAAIQAAGYGHLEILKYLESLDANVHDQSDRAIKEAAEMEHFDVLQYLLEREYKYNNDVMASVLNSLAISGRSDIIEYILGMPAYANSHLHATTPKILLEMANNNSIAVINHYAEHGLRYSTTEIDRVLRDTTGNMDTISALLNLRLKSLNK